MDRVARSTSDFDEVALEVEEGSFKEADHIFPQRYWQLFRRAFTPRALVFFEFYVELRRINLGKPITTDLIGDYRKATRILAQIKSPVDGRSLSPMIINTLATDRGEVMRHLRKIEAGTAMTVTWRMLNALLVPLILEMCKDKGLYLKAIQRGAEQWPIFRKMSKGQKNVERLKDEDPESYALITKRRQTLEQIDATNTAHLEENGLVVETKMVAGRPIPVGIDPNTGERIIIARDGTRFSGVPPTPMVDDDGNPVLAPLTKEQEALEAQGIPQERRQRQDWTGTAEQALARHENEKRRQLEQLSRVPTRTDIDPESLRVVSEAAIESLDGPVRYMAITDDKAKQGKLTRIFATKAQRMIVAGTEPGDATILERDVVIGDPKNRFRGCFVDDLINGQGRLIEGTAYALDHKTGEKRNAPTRIDPSEREPYVSVGSVTTTRTINGKRQKIKTPKLFVKVAGDRKFTPLLKALKELACNGGEGSKVNCVESIVMTDTRYPAIDPKTGKQKIGPLTGRPVFSNARSFYFDPKDFGLIMESLQGMSLSSAALAEVQDYYKQLTLAERATDDENLTPYGAAELQAMFPDGTEAAFVTRKKKVNDDGTEENKPFDLLKKQRQGLAWLDANGNNGVLALETGVGKTASAVGMMMKLTRDGFLEEGAEFEKRDGTKVKTNGRFLFVCPKSLRGNVHKEIHKFISPAKPLADVVDVLSFREFSGSFHSNVVPRRLRNVPYWKALIAREQARLDAGGRPLKGGGKAPQNRVWNPEVYVSIIFDEAHELKNPDSRASQAALKTENPRKICMTASPMEKNPMDAYVLAAVCNNTPLFGKSEEARANRKTMRRFKKRFCHDVGGRIVGVKKDPLVIRELHTWVKRNVYHADKTQVEEYDLPALTPDTVVSEMPEPVEAAYRDLTKGISKVMQQAARKFRERGDVSPGQVKDAEKIFGRELAPIIKLLNQLSNRPATAFKTMATMMETGRLPGNPVSRKTGEPIPIPRALQQALAKWQASTTPEDLRITADEIGNPKIETAVAHIRTALAQAEGGSRSLIFSDDRGMCQEAVEYISRVVGGQHALCLSNMITIYEGGKPLSQIHLRLDEDTAQALFRKVRKKKGQPDPDPALGKGRMVVHSLPFTERALRKFPDLPSDDRLNKHYVKALWAQFVLQEVIGGLPSVRTATLQGAHYSHGHNLQAFSTVIHLDRDGWNSEAMKQRTARAWRQGQEKGVTEITIDSTYPASRDDKGRARSDADSSLDDIRRIFQDMDGAIFDAIIKEAQDTELGTEWGDTLKRDASNWRLCQSTIALMMSPHVKNSKPPDCGKR